MTLRRSSTVVFTFDTTNAAVWAEDVARDRGLVVEVVPAPEEAQALCDLAIVTHESAAAAFAAALTEEGVGFRIWPDPGERASQIKRAGG